MGIVGTALVLVIILVVVSFGWGYIQDIAFDIIREGENTFARIETSGIIEVTPTASETLCNLTITLFPTLLSEESLGQSGSFFGIGVGSGLRVDFDPDIKEYLWSKCESTKTTLASLLNLAGFNIMIGDPIPASLLCSIQNCPFSASAEIVTRITLTDPLTGNVLDKFNSGNDFEHIADVGGKQSPVVFNPTFRLSDIPHRNYHLDIEMFGQDDTGTFDLTITIDKGSGDFDRFLISSKIDPKSQSGQVLRDEICKSTVTSFPCL